jgi:hypothetical protein
VTVVCHVLICHSPTENHLALQIFIPATAQHRRRFPSYRRHVISKKPPSTLQVQSIRINASGAPGWERHGSHLDSQQRACRQAFPGRAPLGRVRPSFPDARQSIQRFSSSFLRTKMLKSNDRLRDITMCNPACRLTLHLFSISIVGSLRLFQAALPFLLRVLCV